MGEKVIEHAAPAVDTLAQNLLGAAFIVALFMAAIAVWQLIRVQNSRVQDQKEIADRVERLTTQATGALMSTKQSLDALDRDVQNGQLLLTQVSTKLDVMIAAGAR